MLLIGIDEAGYGPRIGPLCHGYCAFRQIPAAEHAPDLYRLLHPAVMRHPAFYGSITVDDSKRLCNPQLGVALLEQGVRAFMACGPFPPDQALYDALLPSCDRLELAEDPWGRGPVLTPVGNDLPPVATTAAGEQGPRELTDTPGSSHTATAPPTLPRRRKAKPHPLGPPPEYIPPLAEALRRQNLSVLALGARGMSARRYNTSLQMLANKAEVSWTIIAAQLQALVALAAPGEPIEVVIDRQGGRKFYAPRLGALFPGALPWVERETPQESAYRIASDGRQVRVRFLVEADGATLPVALASMAAKLARELCMQRLNAYFRGHAPELKPTAGYYGDASRFIRQTKVLCRELGITDTALIRAK